MRKNKLSLWRILCGTLLESWRAHPPLFTGLIAASILLCAARIGELYAMRGFFDAAALLAQGEATLADALMTGIPLAAVLILSPMIEVGEYIAQGYFWRRGSGHMMALLHKRAGELPLLDFERSATFDDLQKASVASEEGPSASRTIVQFVFFYLPYFLFTAGFLFVIQPVLVLALALLFGTVLLAQIVRASRLYDFTNRTAGLKRRAEHYEACVGAKDYAKETRTLGAFAFFFGKFLDAARAYGKASLSVERRLALIEALLRLANVLGYAGLIALLIYYMIEGSVSPGAFASVFYSVERINDILLKMLDEIGEALTSLGAVSFLHSFLRKEREALSDEPLSHAGGVTLTDASFAYPGGEPVLKGINLTIRAGETLAIVGENGSGKTTLTKLIAGLYRPTRGSLRFSGEDPWAYVPARRYQRISAVFQQFMRYRMTARENMEISEMDSGAPLAQTLHKAGLDPENLPFDLNDMLSREFGGIELSGGQWQRVAIARGFYRSHDMIFLDEPTAAIDPIEESRLFRLFGDSARGKTAVLVTHRLGSARIADRIIVLDQGRIVESGTHEELISRKGVYQKMYAEQAVWYR